MRQPRQPGPPLAAFWCERVVYESFEPDSRARAHTHISRCSMPTPAEAVHAIRVDVRALTDRLAPVERERALSWTGYGGSVGAVAALYRGSRAGSRSVVAGGGSSGPYGRIWSSTWATRRCRSADEGEAQPDAPSKRPPRPVRTLDRSSGRGG